MNPLFSTAATAGQTAHANDSKTPGTMSSSVPKKMPSVATKPATKITGARPSSLVSCAPIASLRPAPSATAMIAMPPWKIQLNAGGEKGDGLEHAQTLEHRSEVGRNARLRRWPRQVGRGPADHDRRHIAEAEREQQDRDRPPREQAKARRDHSADVEALGRRCGDGHGKSPSAR